MQTIIIIIVVVIIIIIIVWFGPMFFSSIHRRKGSYLAYLINWTIFLYIWRFFVLLSSAGLYPWCRNGPQFNHKQYDQKHFIHIFKSKHFLLQYSGKKVNRKRAALGFTPSHDNNNNNKLYLHDHNKVLQYCKSYLKLIIDHHSLVMKYFKSCRG